MSERATFYIKYDGPLLENNEIAAKDLAPALLAVADLIEEANAILNGGSTKICVNVRGSFKNGSFGIDFSIIQDVYQQLIQIVNQEGIITATILLQLLGIDAKTIIRDGLLPLIKSIRSRIIENVKTDVTDTVTIIVEDTNRGFEEIRTSKNVFRLFQSHKIRNAIEKVITLPLDRDGVDAVVIVDAERKNPFEISKSEKEIYRAPELEDELLGEVVTEAFLQIVSLSFKKNNKWRFSRGESVFYAAIEDENFLSMIDRNEIRFSKNDILKVRLRIKETLTGRGIDVDYFIEEVLEHRIAARQLRLPIEVIEDNEEE